MGEISNKNIDFLFNDCRAGETQKRRENRLFEKVPFPYPGGKYKLSRQVTNFIPQSDVFVDVFGGSGAVSLVVKPRVLQVYNDKFAGVYSFYKCVQKRSNMQKLVELLEIMPHSVEAWHDHDHYLREHGLDFANDVERAAMWLSNTILSYGGINATWGYAKTHESPIKKMRTKTANLPHIYSIAKDWQIDNLDWEACIRRYDAPGVIFYLDPPYLGTDCKYKHTMGLKSHNRMLDMIFDECEGTFIVSHYENPVYRARNWDATHNLVALGTASADYKNRKLTEEVLWILR